MKKLFSFVTFIFCISFNAVAQHPQKFDSLYKTIYAKDFCKLMQKNPGVVLLDVRSAGEYSDTSQYNSLNMGHLKGAVNLEIDAMKKNMSILDQYRNKTLVIYCSHSQRSRRVSKLLAENGFTDFYNFNGGMSLLNQLSEKEFPCKNSWIVSGVAYKNLSSLDAVKLIENQKDLIILDVRPAIQYNAKDTTIENNIGRIKGAINIPYAEIKQRISELDKYKNSTILVYAGSGDGDGARAAAELVSEGFTKVYNLLAGINELVASQGKPAFLETTIPFQLVDVHKALQLLQNTTGLVIYDARPLSEYENKDKLSYRNLGSIKNAIHVSDKEFETYTLPANKESSMLIYGNAQAYKFAWIVGAKGYKNVYLMHGLYDFFWSSFNVEDCKGAKNYLVNHDGIY